MKDAAQILLMIDLLLRSLGTRLLAIAALLMTFGLFCWAMRLQNWLAFCIASTFALGILWPVLYIGWKQGQTHD